MTIPHVRVTLDLPFATTLTGRLIAVLPVQTVTSCSDAFTTVTPEPVTYATTTSTVTATASVRMSHAHRLSPKKLNMPLRQAYVATSTLADFMTTVTPTVTITPSSGAKVTVPVTNPSFDLSCSNS